MKILIKVTKDVLRITSDCSSKTHTVSTSCAIAYACREIFPNAQVTYDNSGLTAIINTWVGDPMVVIPMPQSARYFIANFDASTKEERIQMPETSFEIDVTERIVDLIGISEVYRILSESKTLELVNYGSTI